MNKLEEIKKLIEEAAKKRGIKQYSDGKTHGVVKLFPELEQYHIEPGEAGMIMLHCLSRSKVREAIEKKKKYLDLENPRHHTFLNMLELIEEELGVEDKNE